MNDYLAIIKAGDALTEDQMKEAMTIIMDGKASNDDMAEFLTGLAARGETADEITGAARILRERAIPLEAPYEALDCCGTGGDQKGTYNVSTAVALVAASCGVPMAKHGNRASSSKSGAADVLEVLGVNLDLSIEKLEEALKTLHFAFLMAPNHHAAMTHVKEVRKEIGGRTIFNLLGPLINPAGTRYQLMGVYDKALLPVMAEVLHRLGSKRAWVVHGSDGLDEITITGPTYAVTLDEDGQIEAKTITPEHFGLPVHDLEKLIGGSAEDNAAALRAVLEGQKCAYRDIVLANTATVLHIHGSAETLKDGIDKAAESLDSGLAMQTLKDYITFSREALSE
ncbi:MAG: anthranilate phosphoribosyltransferase [Alphaproteobacteria bacterium]|nr:anthranilate phosphoribosyltransferase [Alphaproteobacteria bacterium]